MVNVTIRRITEPAETEVERMVSMLVDMSWKKNIASLYILKDDVDLLRRWYMCIVRGACAGAHQYAAFLESGELVGCVTGYAPGVEFMGDDTQKAQGFWEVQKDVPEDTMNWYIEFMPVYMAMVDAQLGAGARKAAWNMNSLVVRPDYRGKGIGKILMNVIEDLAKRDNVPVILDSDKPDNTVAMYTHLGYEIVTSNVLDGPPSANGHQIVMNVMKKTFV